MDKKAKESIKDAVAQALDANLTPADICRVVQSACLEYGKNGCSTAIKTVLDHINAHYQDRLTLESLAREAYIDRTYLCTLFKKEMGQNIFDYIAGVRVQKSKAMLYNAALQIKEVARLSGFSTSSYYTKVFKKIEGNTPGEFRLMNKIA